MQESLSLLSRYLSSTLSCTVAVASSLRMAGASKQQCAQLLAGGTQCRNFAKAGSRYCHIAQHDGRKWAKSAVATPHTSVVGLGGDQNLTAIAESFSELSQRFTDLGFKLYLVGGVVRDRMLGEPLGDTADIDMTTDAQPEAIREALEGWADTIWGLGEKFGTVAARKDGRDLEITTHRSEQYATDSRKPTVQFSVDLRDDLARRDFTFNAMAYDLHTGTAVDPFGGMTDLAAGRLRTPLEPEITFSEDPLRMLRAARFAARFGLRPDERLVAAMETLKERLCIVSIERVEQEMDKLLSLPDPMPGLGLLRRTDVAEVVLPGFTAADERAMSAVPEGHGPNARLAALAANRLDVNGDDPLSRWRMSGAKRKAVRRTAAAARDARGVDPANLPSVRRWILSASEFADDGLAVAEQVYPNSTETIKTVRETAEEVRKREPRLRDDPLSGREIMALLNLEPGPRVGEAKKWLREQQIANGPLSKRTARKRLRQWQK